MRAEEEFWSVADVWIVAKNLNGRVALLNLERAIPFVKAGNAQKTSWEALYLLDHFTAINDNDIYPIIEHVVCWDIVKNFAWSKVGKHAVSHYTNGVTDTAGKG